LAKNREGSLLEIRSLVVKYAAAGGEIAVLRKVSLSVPRGSIVGVVGESGCGKSTLALAILRLIRSPGRITGGKILFKGRNLLALAEDELNSVRGRKIGLVFQEPAAALNPVLPMGVQFAEGLQHHLKKSRKQARELGLHWFAEVGIPDPQACMKAYSHQLSGGMRQRALIAMALSLEPDLLIGDEPTSSVDAHTQGQIIALLMRLRKKLGLSMILISHDIGLVREFSEEAVVLFAGQIVESGPSRDVFKKPAHPYTETLLKAVEGAPDVARPGSEGAGAKGRFRRKGCVFSSRCPEAEFICFHRDIDFFKAGDKQVRCHLREGRGD
jgi:oligopeptide/dipeptide ABC transporter ATP-binding protein